jgi:hypothetical protein
VGRVGYDMTTDSWVHSWGRDGRREGTTPRPSRKKAQEAARPVNGMNRRRSKERWRGGKEGDGNEIAEVREVGVDSQVSFAKSESQQLEGARTTFDDLPPFCRLRASSTLPRLRLCCLRLACH